MLVSYKKNAQHSVHTCYKKVIADLRIRPDPYPQHGRYWLACHKIEELHLKYIKVSRPKNLFFRYANSTMAALGCQASLFRLTYSGSQESCRLRFGRRHSSLSICCCCRWPVAVVLDEPFSQLIPLTWMALEARLASLHRLEPCPSILCSLAGRYGYSAELA